MNLLNKYYGLFILGFALCYFGYLAYNAYTDNMLKKELLRRQIEQLQLEIEIKKRTLKKMNNGYSN